ncbi:ornithine carbamoyltransferase, partial [Klebsiella pneumoniae]|nr:ornithine carbamoyltransferase [Klebsiella pneumoniae]
MSGFYHKHFLKLLDFTPAELNSLLQLAAKLKADKKSGKEEAKLTGKNIALIFEKD